MTKRRVVITGLGAVTPCGIGVDEFWKNMLDGVSGISLTEAMDTERHTVKISGEIKNFEPEKYLDAKEAKRMDRFTQFAMVAADEAIRDAGLTAEDYDPYKVGVIVSAAAGGFKTFEKSHKDIIEKGPTKCSPFTIPMLIVDMPSGRISMKYGFKGVNKAVVSACATGSHSVGDAFRSIQYGDADVMIAGGCEATITTLGIGAFTAA
ncbi:beta-ketoacyl-[bacterium]|nr:beta-ketoacyl-[acyl-carrier-protein] synthase II [bacterium]